MWYLYVLKLRVRFFYQNNKKTVSLQPKQHSKYSITQLFTTSFTTSFHN